MRGLCKVAVLICLFLPVMLAAQASDWQGARWIESGGPVDAARMPLFRQTFRVNGALVKAQLRISGLGQFEAHVNGRNVTDAKLTPGWTDYDKRVFYESYDVTRLLHPGGNALKVSLGNGMYNVVATQGRYTKFANSARPLQLIASLTLRYKDGRQQTVVSDDSWQWHPGPIVFTSIYGGEDYDARLEEPRWDRPDFSARTWLPVQAAPGPGGVLRPEATPPVKRFERLRPIALLHPRADLYIYDLGRNFAGWPEIAVRGDRGDLVKMLPGELLDSRGYVTQRSANMFPGSEDSFTYTLRGKGLERWHPQFSYTGFRYVQVQTLGRVNVERLAGRALHQDARVVGSFHSSDALLNQTHRLITRAMLSNLMSVITDCPHREKLGWLEQTHLAATALMENYDLQKQYSKLADDLEDAQQPDGSVPDIAPEYVVFEQAFRDSPEWGAAVVLSTWAAYQAYGEVEELRRHYNSMQRYAAYLHGKLSGNLLEYGLGDWYDIGPGDPGPSKLTSRGLTATATYYELLTDLAKIANLLGRQEDGKRYEEEAAKIKEAFNQRFFFPEKNSYDTGSQTANAMPLAVGLIPQEHRAAVLASLVTAIGQNRNHVTSGDVGFHYLIRALTDGSRADIVYSILSQTEPPSYGDLLSHGATTLTEAWDANPKSSQNHFMLGHAEEWFYRGLAGIDIDRSRAVEERIWLQPSFPGDLQWVSADYHSSLGLIRSRWTRRGSSVLFQFQLPVRSTLQVPAGFSMRGRTGTLSVSAGRHRVVFIPMP